MKDSFTSKTPFLQRTYIVFLGALLCCILWGSATPCIKGGYAFFSIGADDVASRILFAGIRFFIAGFLTIIFGSLSAKKLLLPTTKSWNHIFILCMFQTVIQYFFFYGGLAHASGVKSSIIGATNVFVSIIVASLIFHQEKLTSKKILGCLFGFSGVVLLNIAGNSNAAIDSSFKLNGEGFILLSTISYSLSSVFMKRFSKEENPVMLSGWQFVFGGFIMAAGALCFGGHMTIAPGKTVAAVTLMAYMALISAVSYSIWGLLLKFNHVSRVVVFGFLNPVFGVILSAIFLHEGNQTGFVTILSLAAVCAGIIVVSVKKE